MPRIAYQIYRDDGAHIGTGHVDTLRLGTVADVRRALSRADSLMLDNERREDLDRDSEWVSDGGRGCASAGRADGGYRS